jgi:flagellar motor component MotA
MNSVNNKALKASLPGRLGGLVLQAAALIIIAASAIAAAASSRHQVHEKCNHEWDAAFTKENAIQYSNILADTQFFIHLK